MADHERWDLVDRLRRRSGLTVESCAPHLSGGMKFYVYDVETRAAMTEAADEIERLRAENAAIRTA